MLTALIVAMAVTMPAGVRAMPMPPAASGMSVEQPCQNCPQGHQTGDMSPGKMPACQVLICTGALAVLPAPTAARWRAYFAVAYDDTPPARWTKAAPAPDPFPPRPIVLL